MVKCMSCVEPELCRRKADSHMELDGVHHGFYRGSVAVRLSPVICWRPRPPQSPTSRLSALCSEGAHDGTWGGQPPHSGRTQVKKTKKTQPSFVILLLHIYWSAGNCLVMISDGRAPLESWHTKNQSTRRPETAIRGRLWNFAVAIFTSPNVHVHKILWSTLY